MPLSDSDIKDLVTGTLKHLGRLKFNQIATRLQDYEVMQRMMKRDRVQLESGQGIQRQIMIDHSAAAKNVGLYEVDDVNVRDVLDSISVPFRHTTTNYAFERRELAMNRPSPQRSLDLLKVRRADAMISLVERMEEDFWDKPATSTDKVQPFGIDYWLVSGGGSTGFEGGNPSGFTSGAGGIDSDTVSRWRNYTDRYTDVTKGDLIKKMRVAYRKIGFKSPVDIPDYRKGRGQNYRIYCDNTTITEMEELGEAQNENLGRDLATMDDMMTFRRNPLIWVPQLDDRTVGPTSPVYMVNFSFFYPVFLRGEYLREGEPRTSANQHTVMVVHVDLSWNILCTDRRRHALLDKA